MPKDFDLKLSRDLDRAIARLDETKDTLLRIAWRGVKRKLEKQIPMERDDDQQCRFMEQD